MPKEPDKNKTFAGTEVSFVKIMSPSKIGTAFLSNRIAHCCTI
jgi:hypothetical protein